MDDALRSALRGHRRRRVFRNFLAGASLPGALLVSLFYDFNRTETLIVAGIGLMFASIIYLEVCLKTVQIRLAGMEDKLDRIAGNEDEGNFLSELSDW